MTLTYSMHGREPRPTPEPYVYRTEASFGPQGEREEVILVENEFAGRHILGNICGTLVDETGHIYKEVIGGYSRTGEKKMNKIEILSFEVGNITITKRSTGRIDATYGAGERKSFVFLLHDGQPYPSSVCNLEHYYIGEDFEGADLMEFNGMDYVRTVKRVVRKSRSEMFKELLEMLEGCLVLQVSNATYIFYRDKQIYIGCGEVFYNLRPYMCIKMDSPHCNKFGVIVRQPIFGLTKELEKLVEANEEQFIKTYNDLRGM